MIDPKFRENDLEGDILILFNHEFNAKSSALAYAFPCEFHPKSYRPILGLVVFNWKNMKNFSNWALTEHFNTLVHEIHHVLGFAELFFGNYNIKWDGQPLK